MVDKIEKLLLCDCEGSQKVDSAALADATGLKCSKVYSELCIKNLDIVEKAIQSGDTAISVSYTHLTLPTKQPV